MSHITPYRIYQYKQGRYNPIRNLTPLLLSQQMDWFDAGTLNDFARTMDAIQDRDDTVRNVISKRVGAVKRMRWEIITDPNAPKGKAEAHKKALTYFYNNLTATNAIDLDQRGGFSLLVEQMMDAVGKKYAVHELLWKPDLKGLTCQFNFVPLWFFENRYGMMRFLEQEGMFDGIPMAPHEWMVTCGMGLMKATAVSYMYKNLSLKDWVSFNEKHGMPWLHAKSEAKYESPEWTALVEALQDAANEYALVTGQGDELNVVNTGNAGTLPFPELVERMDRFIAALWRGGDLSTMAKGGDGVGATPQQDEVSAIEQGDAMWISETLQMKIDPIVIGYHFGDTKPMAYVKVCAPEKKNIPQELSIDRFFLENGVPLGQESRLEFYNRALPAPGETPMRKSEPKPGPERFAANERGDSTHVELVREAMAQVGQAEAQVLRPVFEELEALLEIGERMDEQAFRTAAKGFLARLPGLQREIQRNPEGARAFEALMGAGLINGLTEANVRRN